MAPKLSPLPLIRATIATLKARLPAQVAAFNAEPENLVDLVAPATAAYYEGGSDTRSAIGFPAIEVQVARFSLGLAALRDGASHSDERDLDSWLRIIVWVENDSGELGPFYEQLSGLTRCVLEVVLQRDALGDGVEVTNQPNAVDVRFQMLDRDPFTDEPYEKWRAAAEVTLRLEDVTVVP